jgi:hypothetical protein
MLNFYVLADATSVFDGNAQSIKLAHKNRLSASDEGTRSHVTTETPPRAYEPDYVESKWLAHPVM